MNGISAGPIKTLAASGLDKLIHLWDITTGRQQSVLAGHKFSVQSLAFSPDGKLLASIATNETARLWDLSTGLESASLKSPLVAADACVTFSPDGKTLAVAATTISLWDVSTRQMHKKIIGINGQFSFVAFSPNGRILAGCSAVPMGSNEVERFNHVTLWDVSSSELRDRLPDALVSSDSMVRCVALSPQSQTLAAATNQKTALHQVLGILERHHGAVRSTIALLSQADGDIEVVAAERWHGSVETMRLSSGTLRKEKPQGGSTLRRIPSFVSASPPTRRKSPSPDGTES